MIRLLPSSRSALLLTVLLGMAVVSIGFPLPRLQALQSSRLTSRPIGQEESRMSQREMMYPSFSLRDWSIQMSAPEFTVPKPKTQLPNDWLPISQSQMEELQNDGDLDNNSPSDWSSMPGNKEKRNLVVADDAAFRQKSKLLTAMERQKWLNSYMQKLLVVNS